MKYKPITCVWEVTMACNMRCKHCGSSCSVAKEDELTTEEAVKLCKEFGDLGLRWVVISGGEALTRKDWYIIAQALTDNNVIPNLITNGWLLNEATIRKAEEVGINSIAISIDGTEKNHDYIRKPGAFKKALEGLDLLKESNIHSTVITTINSKNINELSDMKKIFIEHGVTSWQLQIGLPMGNLSHNKDLLTTPEMINNIIDFAYDTVKEGLIKVDLADCIGYFNAKEAFVRQSFSQSDVYYWDGCGAGTSNFGILSNGDVLGCTSIRDEQFIEGNVRERSLTEIWNDENSFKWMRSMSKDLLKGKCSKCIYGDLCKGGCSNTRLTMNGSIYSENKYCSYNLALNKVEDNLKLITDIDTLIEKSNFFIENKNYQLAELALSIASSMDENNICILDKLVHVNYELHNYTICNKLKEKIHNLKSMIK